MTSINGCAKPMAEDLPEGSAEYLGLREVCVRYRVPYSSLRGWIHAGLIPAWSTPNNRTWVRASDVEQKLFRRIEPRNPTDNPNHIEPPNMTDNPNCKEHSTWA